VISGKKRGTAAQSSHAQAQPASPSKGKKLSDSERATILAKRKLAAQRSKAKLAEGESLADAAIKSGTYKPGPLMGKSKLPFPFCTPPLTSVCVATSNPLIDPYQVDLRVNMSTNPTTYSAFAMRCSILFEL
jgi:hypothetical protein